MLKYFAPLCGPFTPRAVFKMFWNGSQKCTKGPLTSCMLHASGGALWGHTIMPQHVKCLPPLRSWGMGSCWYEGPSWLSVSYKSCLFRVPLMFSAGGLFVLESQKMSEHASNTHKPREPGTVRNRSWPFLTVPSTRDAPTIHLYNAAKLCFIVFWPLFQCARTGRERFWTIPDCSCFTGIPKSYCFTGFATISYWLCFVMLAYGQCCHVVMTLFSELGRFETESKNHRHTFPKHSVSVARGRANRTIYGMLPWLTSLSTCSLAIWRRRWPHVTGMFLLFAGVMRGSWQQRYIESPLVLLYHRHSYSTNSQYSFPRFAL